MVQAEIIAVFHAVEAEQVQRERSAEQGERGRKRDEIHSCQRCDFFRGNDFIPFAQTARNSGYSLSLSSPL